MNKVKCIQIRDVLKLINQIDDKTQLTINSRYISRYELVSYRGDPESMAIVVDKSNYCKSTDDGCMSAWVFLNDIYEQLGEYKPGWKGYHYRVLPTKNLYLTHYEGTEGNDDVFDTVIYDKRINTLILSTISLRDIDWDHHPDPSERTNMVTYTLMDKHIKDYKHTNEFKDLMDNKITLNTYIQKMKDHEEQLYFKS